MEKDETTATTKLGRKPNWEGPVGLDVVWRLAPGTVAWRGLANLAVIPRGGCAALHAQPSQGPVLLTWMGGAAGVRRTGPGEGATRNWGSSLMMLGQTPRGWHGPPGTEGHLEEDPSRPPGGRASLVTMTTGRGMGSGKGAGESTPRSPCLLSQSSAALSRTEQQALAGKGTELAGKGGAAGWWKRQVGGWEPGLLKALGGDGKEAGPLDFSPPAQPADRPLGLVQPRGPYLQRWEVLWGSTMVLD